MAAAPPLWGALWLAGVSWPQTVLHQTPSGLLCVAPSEREEEASHVCQLQLAVPATAVRQHTLHPVSAVADAAADPGVAAATPAAPAPAAATPAAATPAAPARDPVLVAADGASAGAAGVCWAAVPVFHQRMPAGWPRLGQVLLAAVATTCCPT